MASIAPGAGTKQVFDCNVSVGEVIADGDDCELNFELLEHFLSLWPMVALKCRVQWVLKNGARFAWTH